MGVVYKATNIVNGKVYVGKTMIGHKQRWTQHRICARRGYQAYFYRAIRKYGEENFVVEVLTSATDERELATLEIYWIAKLQCAQRSKGYNCTIGGEGRIHTESSRALLRGIRCNSPETRAKISKSKKGKPVAPEHRALCGNAMRGTKRPVEEVTKRAATIREVWTPEKRAAWGTRMRACWTLERRLAVGIKSKAQYEAKPTPHFPMSVSTRLKCSNASKDWWDSHPEAKENISKRIWSAESKAKAKAAAIKGWALRRGAVAISEKAEAA